MNKLFYVLLAFAFSITANAQNESGDPQKIDINEYSIPDSLYNPSGKVEYKLLSPRDEQVLANFRMLVARLKNSNASEPLHLLDSTVTIHGTGLIWTKYIYEYSVDGELLQSTRYIQNGYVDEDASTPYRMKQYSYDHFGNINLYKEYSWNHVDEKWQVRITEESVFESKEYLKSRVTYSWNDELSELEGMWKFEYEYAFPEKRSVYTSFSWNSEFKEWDYDQRDIRSYDEQQQWNKTEFYNWNDELSSWEIYKKGEFNLDIDANRTLDLYSLWDAEGSEWINSHRFEYMHENGYRKYGEYSVWNIDSHVWDSPTWKYEYNHDGNGNEIFKMVHYWDADLLDWVGDTKNVRSFDNENRLLSYESYDWNVEFSQWVGVGGSIQAFDKHGNQTLHIYTSWSTELMEWTGRSKTESSYDENDLLLNSTSSYSEEHSHDWMYQEKRLYYYNEFDQNDYELEYWWNSVTMAWPLDFNMRKDYYYTIVKGAQIIDFAELGTMLVTDGSFELIANTSAGLPINYTSSDESVAIVDGAKLTILKPGISTITATQDGNGEYNAATPVARELNVIVTDVEDNIEVNDLAVYPNPSKDRFSLSKFSDKVNQIVIYNIQGKAIKTFNKPQQFYNVSDLPTGLYSLIIRLNNEVISRKLLKE